ncbi:hypothetical protein [Chryseolinea sp. H1M3-3]|uniref:DUF6941 family protein n=1 Tax=Chryseolinea sp. H1M3-3 TaxID=3034144 RepID=UPI0023ED1B53|nr:hypothetical protein [Chryseolinea sp. H1M3-3]
MVLEIYSLADYACDYGNGKLSVIGTFDAVFAQQLPAVHPQCAIAARMRFGNNEAGHHSFEIRALSPDGKVIQTLNGQGEIIANPNFDYSTQNLVMNMVNFPLEKLGAYAFEFWLDGEFHSGLKMHVLQSLPPGMVKAA